MNEIATAVLGASGYAAGELLRLVAFHPHLHLAAAVSGSRAGKPIAETFSHLQGAFDDHRFASDKELDELVATGRPLAVFSCLPHGATAARLDRLLTLAEEHGAKLEVVDLSADFRLPSPTDYQRVYGAEHPAPGRYRSFYCGLPELTTETPQGCVAHPGCFTTAVTLACAPVQAAAIAQPIYRVSAVTGSTGSGRTPTATTHHPERHASLKAYKPLAHRHQPEMKMLLGRLGGDAPDVHFVPHSGPWSRGIHATVHLDLNQSMSCEELAALYTDFYAESPLISVSATPPRLKDVVGTNRCQLGVAVDDRTGVVFSVIDNLTKGAAGGGVHWMNRLCGFDETAGLELPAIGWS